MSTNKKFEVVIIWVLMGVLVSGCVGVGQVAQVAPLKSGEVFNLYPGFTNWLSSQGDALVRIFFNPETEMAVFARPFEDGWAVAVTKGSSSTGYLMSVETWNGFREWLMGAGGFVSMLRTMPIVTMPVFVMPVIDTTPVHAWDVMPWMPGGGCGVWDDGRSGCVE